jgi:DeoR/GlpR family transcriptional regulator of sugar metabolism
MATDIPRFSPVSDGINSSDHASVSEFSGLTAYAVRSKSRRFTGMAALAAYSTYRYRVAIFSGIGFAAGTALTIYSTIVGR